MSYNFIQLYFPATNELTHCRPGDTYERWLIPAWISNHMSCNVWDEITYPFLNFNGATVEV